MSNYKKIKTFEERCQESARILEKYPDRVPIFVEKDPTDTLTAASNGGSILVAKVAYAN